MGTRTEKPENPPPVCLCQRTAENGTENRAALGPCKEDGHGECTPFWFGCLKLCQDLPRG
jgi:hypothetical protein